MRGAIMKPIEFEDGAVQVDASIVAEGLGLALPLFRAEMRAGRITSVSERGIDADSGLHRLTFFSGHRRFSLVVAASAALLQRSPPAFWAAPLPQSGRKSGGGNRRGA